MVNALTRRAVMVEISPALKCMVSSLSGTQGQFLLDFSSCKSLRFAFSGFFHFSIHCSWQDLSQPEVFRVEKGHSVDIKSLLSWPRVDKSGLELKG